MAEQHVGGAVSGVQNRTEVYGGGVNNSASSVNILVFRLTPEDGTRPLNVEMRGSRINGTVVDGESVDVYGTLKRNGVFRARRIVSRETGTTIDTKLPALAKVAVAVIFALVLSIMGFVAYQFFRSDPASVRPDPRPTLDSPEDLRERARQECYANPNFTREQCDFVHG